MSRYVDDLYSSRKRKRTSSYNHYRNNKRRRYTHERPYSPHHYSDHHRRHHHNYRHTSSRRSIRNDKYYHRHRSHRHHRDRHSHRRSHQRNRRPSYDDEEGHYLFRKHECLGERYEILHFMGEGTFARVVECWDQKGETKKAVKIVRSRRRYTDAAKIETDILRKVNEKDPTGENHCVRLYDEFIHRNHMCIVFDRYGPSLFEWIRKNNYVGFPFNQVQAFAKQMFKAIAFLHEDLHLVHTDLKPENILLEYGKYYRERINNRHMRVPKYTDIKVIDFGSATFEDQHHSSIISTRHYRAPEVILGLGWSYPADIWSLGCILYELFTGDAMFQTHENAEHLAMMERIIGDLPLSMTKPASEDTQKYFKSGILDWPAIASSSKSVDYVRHLKSLEDVLGGDKYQLFLDLIRQCLTYEPDKRITAAESLKHPFFASPVS